MAMSQIAISQFCILHFVLHIVVCFGFVLNFMLCYSDLFRISYFEFRIFYFLLVWFWLCQLRDIEEFNVPLIVISTNQLFNQIGKASDIILPALQFQAPILP